MEVAVAGHELELLKEFLIVHDVEGVEHVDIVLLGLEESVLEQTRRVVLGRHVIQEIGRLKRGLNPGDYLHLHGCAGVSGLYRGSGMRDGRKIRNQSIP